MITLTISNEQIDMIKYALETEYFEEPVNVTEYAIMVWFQNTLANLIGDPAFYADGPYGYNNTRCPEFLLSGSIRDDRRFVPDGSVTNKYVNRQTTTLRFDGHDPFEDFINVE